MAARIAGLSGQRSFELNLFFRRIWVLFVAAFSSKRSPLNCPYVLNYRVWLTDQDMFMHMTNSRYLSFSDLARLNLLVRTGLANALHKNGWQLEICGQTRTLTRMLKAPQAFKMICEIDGWTDTHIAFNHVFQRRSSTHAAVNTLMRVADADGNTINPQALIDAVSWTETSPELPEYFAGLMQELGPYTT